MSETYLLAFHLGPVQDFIVTARRTQDWWMGSWLLSHLSQTAMKALPKGTVLVVPEKVSEAADATVADTPNHFTARLFGPDPAADAGAVEMAVRNRWQPDTPQPNSIGQTVKKAIFRDVDEALW